MAPCRAVAALFVATGVAACGDGPNVSDRPPPPSRVVGLVAEVHTEADAVTGFVLEAEGERYDVLIDPETDYGFDLSHLREHQRLEQPVDVALELREDGIYATEILDA